MLEDLTGKYYEGDPERNDDLFVPYSGYFSNPWGDIGEGVVKDIVESIISEEEKTLPYKKQSKE